MVSALIFWRQIRKSMGWALLIRRNILMLVLYNQHCTIFSYIFCLMFLIHAIKPNVEKNFFMQLVRGSESGASK
jgi:hypothetical protein